ncbi:unnamed protein product, partial [Rotaria sordida]
IQPLTLINNFDKYWCTTTYYEPDIQVGETFKIHDTYKEVTIDGGTDMAISTITLKKNDKVIEAGRAPDDAVHKIYRQAFDLQQCFSQMKQYVKMTLHARI